MSHRTGLKGLDRSAERAGYDLVPTDPEDQDVPEPPRRITSFLPPLRGRMSPVIGQVGNPAAVQALAVSGGGWINRDGRILSEGSYDEESALSSLPETAAILEAHRKVLREYEDLDPDVVIDESIYPSLEDLLARAGWIRVDLGRDHGVKKAGCQGFGIDVTSYREVLITLGTELGCRVVRGELGGATGLLFDPTDNDGLGYPSEAPTDPGERSTTWPLWSPKRDAAVDEDDNEEEDMSPSARP